MPYAAFYADGWYETYTEGLGTLYLTITDEGLVTVSDTPSYTNFQARLLNGMDFSMESAPGMWVWGDTSTQLTSFGSFQLSNYDGFYDWLLAVDFRDSVIVVKTFDAKTLGTTNLVANGFLWATAIVEDITSDSQDVITIVVKGTLARLDKGLPVKFNPPFVASGAAGVMVPLTFGAVRNRLPLLVDEANRLYQIHDANIPNIVAARDKGAELDKSAAPPQYVPALSGTGIALDAPPQGKFTVDCSSYGLQATLPGAPDVLAGDGAFAGTWTGTPAVPPNWTWSNNAGSGLIKTVPPAAPFNATVNIFSNRTWAPAFGMYGDQLEYGATTVLQAGRSYRIEFKALRIYGTAPYYYGGMPAGIMLRSALNDNPLHAISPHGQPLTQPAYGTNQYSFDYTVPPGTSLPLYILAVAAGGISSGSSSGQGGGIIYDVKVKLLGQYVDLPLQSMPLTNYFTEILVNRAGEPATIFNSADTDAIWAATPFAFGKAYDAQPNILQALRDVLDSFLAALYEDNAGVIRVGQLSDPKLGTPIADFTPANSDRPHALSPDYAVNLTTLIGSRCNASVYSDSDFVSDASVVTENRKTQFTRTSQFQRTSTIAPAGQYAFAVGAPQFESCLDDPDNSQVFINRVNSLYALTVYADGTVFNGRRRFVEWTARWDDPNAIGVTITTAVTNLVLGKTVLLSFPDHGFNATPVLIVGWKPYPLARKIVLRGYF